MAERSSGGLAAALAEGLRRELYLTPKPGLVDRDDCGSHRDLSLALMERSVDLVEAYLGEVARSAGRGEPLPCQVSLARQAEARMAGTLGTNTHKGAIFLGGLLLVARARCRGDDEGTLRRAIASAAAEVAPLRAGVDGRRQAPGEPGGATHGEAARRAFQVGGILEEAGAGLPAVFDAALPAYRAARHRGLDGERAAFAMLAALMQTVEDTTALHRCGRPGLLTLRADGARLEALLEQGAHLPFLRQRNADYLRLNLTMGGVADLLGVAFGWLGHLGELPP